MPPRPAIPPRRCTPSPHPATPPSPRQEEVKERRPRPRLTSREEDANIRRAVQEDPFTKAVAIRDRLYLNVTPETVRNHLNDAGIHHRIPAKRSS
ncbi:hypothetical protein Pcinc_009024 [Petrolisthes cinctipes]|uniref:Transposase n=1 Tax=Petrolisthes cinctipes TaxID=88211 RepID=A0AAE1KWQ0_PETCI|nr:hypothetical protein Pcinc_009024 [Petrolisthes cinctipes]